MRCWSVITVHRRCPDRRESSRGDEAVESGASRRACLWSRSVLPLINFSRKIFRKKIVGFKTHFSLFLRKMSRKKTRQAGFTTANHRFCPQNTVKNPMPAICARQEPLRGPAALGAEGLHPGGAQAELQRPCGWVGVTAAVGQ